MRAVILAGGLGTRLSEETTLRPKPMVEIGGRPILWHIMKSYSSYGISDFVVCLGYKGYVIKEYFANYFLHMSDVTFDMRSNDMVVHRKAAEPWTVTLVHTGVSSNTGGRLKRVVDYLSEDEDFCFTYGDGLSSANLADEVDFHRSHGAAVTLLSVAPPGRYGALRLDGTTVTSFEEKPAGDGARINGGFFVMNRAAIDWIEGDSTSWEGETLPALAAAGDVRAFEHDGFWQPMDTLRDKNELEDLWTSGRAPWKSW